ncbi:MAG: Nif3-like dinuclear metal center hexameric protein [Acidimicrobiia bacterium]
MSNMTVSEHVEAVARLAPFELAAGWDPVGLQLGDPNSPVELVAVCHEVTHDVVEAAVGREVDLLVSYHPLLFRPTTRLVAGASAAGRAHRLVSAGVALGIVHTAFDVAPGGTADALAETLGLHQHRGFGPLWSAGHVSVSIHAPTEATAGVLDALDSIDPQTTPCRTTTRVVVDAGEEQQRVDVVVPERLTDAVVAAIVAAHPDARPHFQVVEARADAGFVGRVGALDAPTSLNDLVGSVDTALGVSSRVAPSNGSPSVERLAVLPGSGGSFVHAAAAAGADVLVTGDVSHHEARAANELGLSVIDPGHSPTEFPGVAKLYAAVSAIGTEAVDLTTVDANPWEAN